MRLASKIVLTLEKEEAALRESEPLRSMFLAVEKYEKFKKMTEKIHSKWECYLFLQDEIIAFFESMFKFSGKVVEQFCAFLSMGGILGWSLLFSQGIKTGT